MVSVCAVKSILQLSLSSAGRCTLLPNSTQVIYIVLAAPEAGGATTRTRSQKHTRVCVRLCARARVCEAKNASNGDDDGDIRNTPVTQSVFFI